MAKRIVAAPDEPSRPKRMRPLPLYEASSQFRHWRFSSSRLDQLRHELNAEAVKVVAAKVEQERVSWLAPPLAHPLRVPCSSSTHSGFFQAQAHATASTETDRTEPAPTEPARIDEHDYLSAADELALVTYYLVQIPALCRAFHLPEIVQATAQSYLKRFYLSNTCMNYHPKHVMLTCVFLGCKTENHMLSIDGFASKLKETPASILDLEFLVSQSLKFEYKVHHAFTAVQGLGLDLQTTPAPLESISSLYDRALKHARTARLTDLEFLYSPSQIALSCVRLVDPLAVETWLDAKFDLLSKKQSGAGHDEDQEYDRAELDKRGLLKQLDRIAEVIKDIDENGAVDKEKVKEIDRRLKSVSNPEKDPKSTLYKQKQEDLARAREEKSKAKSAARPQNDDSSVFD
ncbi:BQ2448_1232 [Microbotryum intermedium]|uniref:BQ2448_1232 protein n=1 Tax=Microbotryum intermedium TaxID=269621 RepID=A0A238FFC3_9BASI|nr:BQ2448_1232 [Microbotryum intermedium]